MIVWVCAAEISVEKATIVQTITTLNICFILLFCREWRRIFNAERPCGSPSVAMAIAAQPQYIAFFALVQKERATSS
jgi:hypothetical protein